MKVLVLAMVAAVGSDITCAGCGADSLADPPDASSASETADSGADGGELADAGLDAGGSLDAGALDSGQPDAGCGGLGEPGCFALDSGYTCDAGLTPMSRGVPPGDVTCWSPSDGGLEGEACFEAADAGWCDVMYSDAGHILACQPSNVCQ